MRRKATEIEPKHLKVEANWLPFQLNRNDAQSSLLYYPNYYDEDVTVKAFTDAINHLRGIQKMYLLQFPHHLPEDFQYYLWSFRKNEYMIRVKHEIESEITLDLRDYQTRHLMKFNDVSTTLSLTVPVIKNQPEFIDRQTFCNQYSVHHLEH